ncbi:MAG TPA: lactonase family protein [Granulicella sp.]|nr:lactonase family protein [Granulicella sp.]
MQKMNRRDFLSSSAALALAAHPLLASVSSQAHLMLLGTQTSADPNASKGIYAYTFDSVTGELSRTGLAAATDSPTFLVTAPDQRTIYAANELNTFAGKPGGAVTSFSLDPTTGSLTQISQVASLGGSTCHVGVDRTGAAVFAANYTGGSAASFHVTSGDHLSPAVTFLQYTGRGPDKDRQQSPHAHRVTVSPDNRYVLVNDLGLDKIHIYQLDPSTGQLTTTGTDWTAPAGSGPRALLFHPSGKFAYCICEMASSVLVLAWDAQAGTLTTRQEFPLPLQPHEGPSTGCDIVLDRHARYAYVANRGDNFLATFAVSPDGSRLTYQRRSSCGGTVPRHIALDPTEHWLLVANQGSDTVAVFARDAQSGTLADTGKTFPVSKPQCLLFPHKAS